MGKKKYGVKGSHGRKNRPRDNTKIKIVFYLYDKGKDTTASRYELIHHSGISTQDYPNMDLILAQMSETKWIKAITSGAKGKEKSNFMLEKRGREVIEHLRSLPDTHPLKDLDAFDGI